MNTIGFVKSRKEKENRIAIIPNDLSGIKHVGACYFEEGYGLDLGYSNQDYLEAGANICSRETALHQDIICDPKIGDAEYLDELNSKIIFGWIHAVQNRDITDKIIAGELTAVAWEDMYETDGIHTFYRNNQIAGEAAIMHAYECYGRLPEHTSAAVLGRGNTATGAIKMLKQLGAKVTQYTRKEESQFRKDINKYDVLVNAILWDTKRTDHIIYRQDLLRMKSGSMIIDISCDRNGGIETSVPTTIDNPTYVVDGVLHYVVDHTPSLMYKEASESISNACFKYIDELITGDYSETLKAAIAINNGCIIDERINEFQNR